MTGRRAVVSCRNQLSKHVTAGGSIAERASSGLLPGEDEAMLPSKGSRMLWRGLVCGKFLGSISLCYRDPPVPCALHACDSPESYAHATNTSTSPRCVHSVLPRVFTGPGACSNLTFTILGMSLPQPGSFPTSAPFHPLFTG